VVSPSEPYWAGVHGCLHPRPRVKRRIHTLLPRRRRTGENCVKEVPKRIRLTVARIKELRRQRKVHLRPGQEVTVSK
jgi:hypothetical protein